MFSDDRGDTDVTADIEAFGKLSEDGCLEDSANIGRTGGVAGSDAGDDNTDEADCCRLSKAGSPLNTID
jgi:hypothetical protein